MARVLIIGVLALFLQLTAGQDAACLNAINTLASNAASCAGTTICSGMCRGYYERVFDNCPSEVSLIFSYAKSLVVYPSTPI